MQAATAVTLFLVGDLIEILHHCDKSSKHLNLLGSKEFSNFIRDCNLP